MHMMDYLRRSPVSWFRKRTPLVAVLRLTGVISRADPFHRGLNLEAVAGPLERAFKMRDVRAVALIVNSPGGSPVQSALIADRIRALAEENDRPVVAFVEDVAASGGYWLATAADEIFADTSSIIGSIGVVTATFGFPEVMRRIGIERRVYATSDHKAALDPFQRARPDDVSHLRGIQDEILEAFRTQVTERRGDRLKADTETLFSGRFWSGKRAVELGLVDGLGHLRGVMRERYGSDVRLRLIAERRPWWRRRLAMSGAQAGRVDLERVPQDWAASLIAAVEDRLWWNRFGL